MLCRCNNNNNNASGDAYKESYNRNPWIFNSTDEFTQLARELNELTFQERENVFNDIHGVADALNESQDFLQERLQEFRQALSKIPKKKRKAYDRAMFLRPSWTCDTKFQIMFLRADQYNIHKAAQRMVNHFTVKLELFGEEKLAKVITLDDFTKEELQATIGSGSQLVLRMKDQVGRPVSFSDRSKIDWKRNDANAMHRAAWYRLMSTVSEDEEAQKKGVCHVSYASTQKQKQTNDSNSNSMISIKDMAQEWMRAQRQQSTIPIRCSSLHYCHDNLGMEAALSMLRLCVGKDVRLRIRTHCGSPTEIRYSILSFGIHAESSLFEDKQQNEQQQYHHSEFGHDYLQRRRAIEQRQKQQEVIQETKTGIILYPKTNDVLIGRGSPFQDFCGNRQLSAIIDSKLAEYVRVSDQFWKSCISMDVVEMIHQKGGRFLQRAPNNTGWTVLNDIAARERTSNLFRYKNRHNNNISSKASSKRKMQQPQQDLPLPIPATNVSGGSSNGTTEATTSSTSFIADFPPILSMDVTSNSRLVLSSSETTNNNNNSNHTNNRMYNSSKRMRSDSSSHDPNSSSCSTESGE